MKNVFIFSEKDLVKLSACLVLAAIFFGISGLFVMLLFQWITRQSYAEDIRDKHGISHVRASRLGGAAVFFCTFGLIIFAVLTGVAGSPEDPYGIYWFGWLAVLACAGLGLVEDINNNFLTPKFRLIIMTAIFMVVIGFWPFLIPTKLEFPLIGSLLKMPVLGWMLTVIFCIGFINAINMADGANGLIPGVLTISFSIFYMETSGFVYAMLMTSCALFTIFNVISGRLFLGDAGAYGLGTALVLSALVLFEQEVFSASFLAVLLAYPCIEILVSVFRRSLSGNSVFLPDDDHLHNRLNFHFQRWFRSKTIANSGTGAFIVIPTSGIALMGYLANWWSVAGEDWVVIFVLQMLVYFLVFYIAGSGQSSTLDSPRQEV